MNDFESPLTTHKLVLVGGGEVLPSIQKTFLDMCGMKNPKILVCGLASSQSNVVQKKLNSELTVLKSKSQAKALDFLTETELETCQGEPLEWKDLVRKRANDSKYLESLIEAQGIFFLGGNQNVILESLLNTSFAKTLEELWSSGKLVVGGTSAGLQIWSEWALTGKFLQQSGKLTEAGNNTDDIPCMHIKKNHTQMVKGFGFLKNTILDQHFLKRQRQNRLFSALLDKPNCLGIGVDESTALCLWKTEGEKHASVVGESSIFIIQPRQNTAQSGDTFDVRIANEGTLTGLPLNSIY